MINDKNFPFPIVDEVNKHSKRYVKVSFNDKEQLIIEKWNGTNKQ